ncbi:MAG: hypothetical protein M3512_09750 [Bacteroidota bacterium]|nr:hypothetical protein [Bacteroidota bacterium]
MPETVKGAIRPKGDKDYFKFTIDQAGVIEVIVSNVASALSLDAILYHDNQAPINTFYSYRSGETLSFKYLLDAGTYYIRLYNSWDASSDKQ